MGAFRVVLYAEGRGETAGEVSLKIRPGDTLVDDCLGPGHLIVLRALSFARSIPEGAIQFEEPLRTHRSQIA